MAANHETGQFRPNCGPVGWTSDCRDTRGQNVFTIFSAIFAGFLLSYRHTRMQIKAGFYFWSIRHKQAYGYIMALIFQGKL